MAAMGTSLFRPISPNPPTGSGSVERLTAEWGALDVLVNNAGIIEVGPLGSFDDAALALTFNTNVVGPMALTRDLQLLLENAGSARVVNVGSVFGDIPYPLLAAYSASKFALRGFSIALRREWRQKGSASTSPRRVQPGPPPSLPSHV